MENVQKEGFKIIGLKVRTTNQNGQAATDIGGLWQKFISEGILDKIPNKVAVSVLSIYCNYESDHNGAYDTILGCMVSTLGQVPEGMIAQEFPKGNYAEYMAAGDLSQGVVYNAWVDIWNRDLDRTYIADFEVYGAEASNPKDATIAIFVGVK
ncbi:unnamed protein product [Ectocarpus sp. 12 AP-2014]